MHLELVVTQPHLLLHILHSTLMNLFPRYTRIVCRSPIIIVRSEIISKKLHRAFTMSSTNHPPENSDPSPQVLSNGLSEKASGGESNQNGTVVKTNGEDRKRFRYVDIGINLTDDTYTGLYHGTQRHPSDMYEVIERAESVGCTKLIVTGSDIEHSKGAIGLAKVFPSAVYATVGIHPCSSSPFSSPEKSSAILSELRDLVTSSPPGSVVVFGEIGLDYDRLTHCSKEVQVASFNAQLDLFSSLPPEQHKPLFLHSRAAHADFVGILRERIANGELGTRGVVHSFTGSREEMLELVELGFDIGVNGCSLKTEENCAVVKEIPLERLQLETDGPWCEMRPAHAGTKYSKEAGFVEKGLDGEPWKWVKKEKFVAGALVKGRNESCLIERVAWAVAGIKELSVQEVVDAAWGNSVRMFGLDVDEETPGV